MSLITGVSFERKSYSSYGLVDIGWLLTSDSMADAILNMKTNQWLGEILDPGLFAQKVSQFVVKK